MQDYCEVWLNDTSFIFLFHFVLYLYLYWFNVHIDITLHSTRFVHLYCYSDLYETEASVHCLVAPIGFRSLLYLYYFIHSMAIYTRRHYYMIFRMDFKIVWRMVLIFHILLEAGADFSNCIASVPGTHCNCYFMYERQLCVCVFQVLLCRKWKYSAGTVLCAVAINVSSTYSIRKLWILSSCSIRSFVRFRFPFFAMRYYQHHSQRICARFVRCMQHTLMRSSALTQPSRTMHSKT